MNNRMQFIEDNDGHYYVIPEGRAELFYSALRLLENEGDYTLWDKHEFESARIDGGPLSYSFTDLELLND